MTLSLRRPSTEMTLEFLGSQSKLDFTYLSVGATKTLPPRHFT